MSLLQFIVIIVAVVFILLGIDLYKRKRMNVLHFFVFSLGGLIIALFAINVDLLNRFGQFFGVARGIELFVYLGIILLFYFYIELLNTQTKDKYQLTRLISQIAIDKGYQEAKEQIKKFQNADKKDRFAFNIRVYNEEPTIGAVIDDIIHAGFRKLVLIDDGSTDNTLQIIKRKQEEYPEAIFIILSHTINRGGGAANQTGFKFINTYSKLLNIDRIVTFDADGQMDITDMNTFIKQIEQDKKQEKNTQIYLGSRFVSGSKTENMPNQRKLILKISKLVTRIFYNSKVSDPHNGYRIIHKDALKKIVIKADGMHYANEIIEQIRQKKIPYQEVPTYIRYTNYSLDKPHGQKNSNGIRLGMEMIYKKIFFR